jgi:hypothetical protein
MPDLDQIKQGEQERRGAVTEGQIGPGRAVAAATPTVLATREAAGCGLLQIRCRCSKR